MICIWSAGLTREERSVTTSSRERNTAWQGDPLWPLLLLLSPMSTFTYAKASGEPYHAGVELGTMLELTFSATISTSSRCAFHVLHANMVLTTFSPCQKGW